MKEEMNFEQTVKSMTAKQIIMAMVEGLRNPWMKVRMSTFGAVEDRGEDKPICYGCAATNTICQIAGKTIPPDYNRRGTQHHSRFLGVKESDNDFVSNFEYAIDDLRSGGLHFYNDKAVQYGFATIDYDPNDDELPTLHDDFTEEQLQKYVDLANNQ